MDGLVHPGDRVADIGCGIGYFTIPLARLVGEKGWVIAVDLQPQMLAGLRRRAARAGLLERIELHQASATRLDIDTPLDFALAFWMIHETPDPAALLAEINILLNPGAALLAVEPRGHVSHAAFEAMIAAACRTGFDPEPGPPVFVSRSILLRKQRLAIHQSLKTHPM
jgi:ubiquinone/menaquinone biosynthesis C-methylase UbiE